MMAEANVVEEGFETGSMQAKLHILQHPMRYASEPSKPTCLPATYTSKCITRLDGEVVDKFGGFAADRICKRTTRAGRAHPLDIGIHSRPIEAEA